MPTGSENVCLCGIYRKCSAHGQNDEIDPNVWSGRALQEDFVELADAVLHQCIRPLIGACCAPGHHGYQYQRAFELISGQASTGPFGSPVFACAGKTDPPSSSHPLADLGGEGVLVTSSIAPHFALLLCSGR